MCVCERHPAPKIQPGSQGSFVKVLAKQKPAAGYLEEQEQEQAGWASLSLPAHISTALFAPLFVLMAC